MILVKSIETIELDGSMMHQIIANEMSIKDIKFTSKNHKEPITTDLIREVVYGTVFRNAAGEEVVVGMSKKVQKAIGIPMSTFRDMNKHIDKLGYEITDLKRIANQYIKQVEKYKSMGYWERFKFFLTGKLYEHAV